MHTDRDSITSKASDIAPDSVIARALTCNANGATATGKDHVVYCNLRFAPPPRSTGVHRTTGDNGTTFSRIMCRVFRRAFPTISGFLICADRRKRDEGLGERATELCL